MRPIIIFLFLIFIATSAFSQTKKRGKVKRKYRDVEKVSQNLPPVFLRGTVYDWDENPVIGASVTIDGTKKEVNTNEYGEFLIEDLITGKARIRVALVGFETKTTDLEIRVGENYKDIMLRKGRVNLPTNVAGVQKREQQLMDIPGAVSSVNSTILESLNITELGMLSEYVPGFHVQELGTNQTNFFIRGIKGDDADAGTQTRIATYHNNVPINRSSLSSIELFDMERVELMKGPQNTLYGRGAMAGVVHYLSKMPENRAGGYLSLGAGNFNHQEFRAAINAPAIKDKLFVRAAGIYHARDGYVDNTFEGQLNGKNTLAGRFTARFIPAWNHKLDLIVNYQRDETPGLAYMSKTFANTNGDIGIFTGTASHEQANNLGTSKDFFDVTLNYKYFISEHSTWTSITSYRDGSSWARWDGDGTASEAIDMYETEGAKQFYQELIGNFSYNSRLIGSLGINYWWEKADRTFTFSTNEQHFASLMLLNPPAPVQPNGEPIVIPVLPPDPGSGITDTLPLPKYHQEETWNYISNQSMQLYMDVSYQVTRKLFVSGGLRGIFDFKKLTYQSEFTDGSPSVLGNITGNAPNLLVNRTTEQQIGKNNIYVNGRVGVKYKFNEYGNVFFNYAPGYRPAALQFNNRGRGKQLNPEILHNFDAGLKASFFERVYADAVGFIQFYRDFQTGAWVGSYPNGDPYYLVTDDGKATIYGIETSVNIALSKQIEIFGNYTWLHTSFDSLNTLDAVQQYAYNNFNNAPEHSFTSGINIQLDISSNIQFFVTPSYSFKSDLYFTDDNIDEIKQNAHGILNVNGGIKLKKPNLTLSVYGRNILDEQYAISGGNTVSLFGIPTFVPGPPRMYGSKLTWHF